MNAFRNNPEGEANQAATRDNERAVFAAKMQARPQRLGRDEFLGQFPESMRSGISIMLANPFTDGAVMVEDRIPGHVGHRVALAFGPNREFVTEDDFPSGHFTPRNLLNFSGPVVNFYRSDE